MSATSVSSFGGNESAYLSKLNFTIMDSGIAGVINPKDSLNEKSVDDFLDKV